MCCNGALAVIRSYSHCSAPDKEKAVDLRGKDETAVEEQKPQRNIRSQSATRVRILRTYISSEAF